MKKWLVICLLLFAVLPANALQQLNFKGFIADEANILSEQVKNDLNMTLWDLQKKSGADIAVVTLPSLYGKSVEETALEIGRTYKIGSKEKNNGVVFLTALSERKMRIELGYGLENKIPVSTLESIRDDDILPYYRQSNYQSGVARGTYQLANAVAHAEGVNITVQGIVPDNVKSVSYGGREVCSTCKRGEFCSYHRGRYGCYPWWIWPLAIILSIFCPRRRRFNYGSFGGFGGGGGFGGCGCSGSW